MITSRTAVFLLLIFLQSLRNDTTNSVLNFFLKPCVLFRVIIMQTYFKNLQKLRANVIATKFAKNLNRVKNFFLQILIHDPFQRETLMR